MIFSILKSSFSLFILKGLNIISPLLLIPLISKSFGVGEVGQLFYYQSLAIVFSLVIEYGFNLYGTKRIAETLSKQKQSQIFFRVFITKSFLFLPVMLICILISLNTNPSLFSLSFFILAFASGLIQGLSPSWYFHGLNEMPKALIAEGRATLIYLALSVSSILYGVGIEIVIFSQFFSRFISYLPVYVKAFQHCIARQYAGLYTKIIIKELKNGWSFFVFRIVSSLYSKTSVFFLGFVADAASVANYSGAEKVAKGAAGLVSPISQALFPRMSYMIKHNLADSKKLFVKAVIILGGCSLFLSLCLYYAADIIIYHMLGKEYLAAVKILKILSILPFVVTVSNLFGVQLLLNLGKTIIFNRVIYFSALLHLVIIFFTIDLYGAIGLARQIVFIELLVSTLMIFLSISKTDYWCTVNEK